MWSKCERAASSSFIPGPTVRANVPILSCVLREGHSAFVPVLTALWGACHLLAAWVFATHSGTGSDSMEPRSDLSM